MATIRGEFDDDLGQIAELFRGYESDRPNSRVELYRWGRFVVKVRVVDPAFAGVSRFDRQKIVWEYLRRDEHATRDVTSVVPVTPAELTSTGASIDFDDPGPPPQVPVRAAGKA